MRGKLIDLKVVEITPTTEPITLAEAKQACIVDFTDDDTFITALITRVRKAAESTLLISITPKIVLFTVDWCHEWKLPRGPHYSINSVSIREGNTPEGYTNYRTLTQGTDFFLDGEEEKTLRACGGRLKITMTNGYGNPGLSCPEDIREGLLQEVSNRYRKRGDEQDYRTFCPAAMAYLDQYRNYSWQ